YRLHLVQRARDTAVVVLAPRQGAVLSGPASRPLDRLHDGYPACRNAGVGPGPGDGRSHAAADQDGEDPAVERPLLGTPDVPAAAHRALARAESERQCDRAPGVQ